MELGDPSSSRGSFSSSSTSGTSFQRTALAKSRSSRVCEAELLAFAGLVATGSLPATGTFSSLAALASKGVVAPVLGALAAFGPAAPPAPRASSGCQGQRWQRVQAVPSLQPRGFQWYLQGSPQPSGWPAEPRDSSPFKVPVDATGDLDASLTPSAPRVATPTCAMATTWSGGEQAHVQS